MELFRVQPSVLDWSIHAAYLTGLTVGLQYQQYRTPKIPSYTIRDYRHHTMRTKTCHAAAAGSVQHAGTLLESGLRLGTPTEAAANTLAPVCRRAANYRRHELRASSPRPPPRLHRHPVGTSAGDSGSHGQTKLGTKVRDGGDAR